MEPTSVLVELIHFFLGFQSFSRQILLVSGNLIDLFSVIFPKEVEKDFFWLLLFFPKTEWFLQQDLIGSVQSLFELTSKRRHLNCFIARSAFSINKSRYLNWFFSQTTVVISSFRVLTDSLLSLTNSLH